MDEVAPAIDRPTVDALLDAFGGDRSFLDELVTAFADDAPGQVVAMRISLEAGDVDAVVRPAHSLKSSSASLGAMDVAARSGAIEAQAREGRAAGLDTAIDELDGALRAALGELEGIAGGA